MELIFLGRGEFRDHDLERFGKLYFEKKKINCLFLNIDKLSILNIKKIINKRICEDCKIILLNQFYSLRLFIILVLIKLQHNVKIALNFTDPHVAYFIDNKIKIKNYSLELLIKKFFIRIYILFNIFFTKFIRIDYIITSGKMSLKLRNQFSISKNMKIISTVHHDYQYYLSYKNNLNTKIERGSICYLDQPLILEKFQNSFAKKLSLKLNLLSKNHKIYFCCHPSSNLIKNNYFLNLTKDNQNIIICKRETPKYIFKSEYILTHHSAATNIAILDYKKIFFLYSNEISRNKNDTLIIQKFSDELGAPILRIENLNTIENYEINKDLYKTFVRNYLYENRINYPIWEYVISHL